MRTCTEIEANFKAIFRANKFARVSSLSLNMKDYYLINSSHFLSDYEVKYPYWKGDGATRRPFAAWGGSTWNQLVWFAAYNKTKHDRGGTLHLATLDNVTEAVAALVIVLAAQFGDNDFGPTDDVLSVGGHNDGMQSAIGGYFRVKYPSNIPSEARYDFTFADISAAPNWIQKFDYDGI